MIPEVVVSMLACARIGALHNVVFGGFSAVSVKERMEFCDAKVLITADEARRKGKTAPIKSTVDEEMGELESLETIVVVRNTGGDCECRTAATSGIRRDLRGRRRRVPAGGRSTPSIRSTSSIRQARPRSPKGSCTPPAAT